MPIYSYKCDICSDELSTICTMSERNELDGSPCEICLDGIYRRTVGCAGFILKDNGKVGWSKDGYATTYGDAENFKAGRKIY